MFSFEGYNLSTGVDPGVGAAGANYPNFFLKQPRQRRLQFTLDRTAPRLSLKPRVVCPIILYYQTDIAHRTDFISRLLPTV